MEYKLENEHLTVIISSLGAEVQSVVSKSDGKEIWWQGDPKFWEGRSPILFPACGGLWDGEYRHNGRSYKMPKHGFVSKMEWEGHVNDEADMATFTISETEKTLEYYPFHFQLNIVYMLDGNQLTCSYSIRNKEKYQFIFYQIGGHPAIALPDYHPGADVIGYAQPLVNEEEEIDARLITTVLAGEQGCYTHQRYPVPSTEDGLIPISSKTFEIDSLIFDHSLLKGFHVLDTEKRPICTVRGEAPVWLLWQKGDPLCPFICVEPWYGLCDVQGESVQLIDRPYSQNVAPNGFSGGILWAIEF